MWKTRYASDPCMGYGILHEVVENGQEGLMVDRALFMEALRSVQEAAKASAGPMEREEIQGYFKGMELSPEQQEMVYQYILQPEGEGYPPEGAGAEPEEDGKRKPAGSRKRGGHSRHFQMYLNEVSKIPGLPEEGKMELYQRLLAGQREAVSEISTQWLKRIAEIAGEYGTARVLVEDLVQEGNMGLLLGLETVLGARGQGILDGGSRAIEQKLESFVREAMEQYRRETEGIDNSDHTILAKVNLIHEAQKVLAEDTGTIPALEELSEYTKIPVDEVRDIMALSSITSSK